MCPAQKYQNIRKKNKLHLNLKQKHPPAFPRLSRWIEQQARNAKCVVLSATVVKYYIARLHSFTDKYRVSQKNYKSIGFSCGINPGKAPHNHKAVQAISDKV